MKRSLCLGLSVAALGIAIPAIAGATTASTAAVRPAYPGPILPVVTVVQGPVLPNSPFYISLANFTPDCVFDVLLGSTLLATSSVDANGGGLQIISGLPGVGSFTLDVIGKNGCTDRASVTVVIGGLPPTS